MVKIQKIKMVNFKNVEFGEIKTTVDFENISEGNVIGIYGQNGSGKTAFVEAMKIFHHLLKRKSLPSKDKFLVMNGKEEANLVFELLLVDNEDEFYVKYDVTLAYSEKEKSDGMLLPVKEVLLYKKNDDKQRYKRLVERSEDEVFVRNKSLSEINEDDRVSLMVRRLITIQEAKSFVFDRDVITVIKGMLEENEYSIIVKLFKEFGKNIHVFDSEENGLVLGNIIMPLNINIDNNRGKVAFKLTDVSVMPLEVYNIAKRTIDQINIVLNTIIPGLEIEVHKLHAETTEEGEAGVRVEFLTNKSDVPLPIRCESAGALKIISVLSILIAAYNNPNACVIIDELDSGIFEFLLGEVLEVISGNGLGQLFFTSHNLRILEVFNHKNLWFTTSNEKNRYVQLKGVRELNNTRDIYLRAVQLGGQNEELYKKTKAFRMKKAFSKAGDYCDK